MPESSTLDAVQTAATTQATPPGGTSPVAAPPAAPAALSVPPSAAPSASAAAPVHPAGSTEHQAAAQAVQRSLRDAFRETGLGEIAGKFQEDSEFLKYLTGMHQQYQQVAPVLRQYGPYLQELPAYARDADDFRRWQAEQQAQRQKVEAEKKKWFPLPDYDPRWKQAVRQNPETGQWEVSDPQFRPDVVHRLREHLAARQELEDKFYTDPEGTLRPLIEHIARQVATETNQQNLGDFQERNFVQNYEQHNAAWLYRRDGQGQPLRDFQGQPVLTEEGQLLHHYAQQARQMGLVSPAQQLRYAHGLLERDVLLRRVGQPAAPAAPAPTAQLNEQQRQQFLQQAAAQHQPQTSPAANGSATPQALALEQRMLDVFKQNGYTDPSARLALAG